MEEKMKTDSFFLGQLVAMIKKADPIQQSWDENAFVLFHANFNSTMGMLIKSIQTLYKESPQSLSQLESKLKSLDFSLLEKEGVDEGQFLKGYESDGLFLDLAETKPTQQDKMPNPVMAVSQAPLSSNFPTYIEKNANTDREMSRSLGHFIALVHCMELACGTFHGTAESMNGKDIFFLLHLNFENTLKMVINGIHNLPQQVEFKGKTIQLEQVKDASALLIHRDLSAEQLDHDSFLKAYDKLVAEYLFKE